MPLSLEKRAQIERLHHAEKWKVGTIARELGLHHRVVRRVLKGPPPSRAPRGRVMDAWRGHVERWLREYPTVGASRLYDMLVERGFVGSQRTLRRMVSQLRPHHRPAYLEIETLAGEQAQVDWADVGTLGVPGGTRRLWLFVMTMSHSRALWGEFVLDLGAVTLCRSLCRAALYFGGVPRVWLFDNTKSVVLERVVGAARLNPLLMEVAAALRVEPRLCAPYQPRDKGKVERAIRYLRERFLAARRVESVAQGNAELLAFLEHVALPRPHPTRPGKTVAQVWEEEKSRLLPLPRNLPETDALHHLRVDRLANVHFETNRYSVPPQHVGQTLALRVSEDTVRIIHEGVLVAEHPRSVGKKQRVENPVHRQVLVQQRRASRDSKGQDRLVAAAPEVADLLRALLQAHHNMGLCTRRMLQLLDTYGAAHFQAGVLSIRVRNICDVGALALACETARRAAQPHLVVPPTFAAHVTDREVTHMNLKEYDHEHDTE